jgi:hypothetical protein
LAFVAQDGTVIHDTISAQLEPRQQLARYLWEDQERTVFKGSLVLRGQSGAAFVALALGDKQGLLTVIPLIPAKAPGLPD